MVECKGPLQMVRNGLPARSKRDMLPSRRHLTDVSTTQSGNPNQVFSRAEPFPGLICGGGPGSAEVNQCKQASDGLRDKKRVELPFIGGNVGCQIQIWPTNRNKKSTETSHSSYSMKEDLPICADSKQSTVGLISNYNGYGYHFFFGKFCGALGSGYSDGCVM